MENQVDQAIDILSRTPVVLKALLEGLSPAWTESHNGEDAWSAYDVLGHLIHGEKTDWLPRARIILNFGTERTFDSFDRFAQFEDSAGKSLADLLDEFSFLRAQNLEALKMLNITSEQLEFHGSHPELGPVALRHLLATWVVHDLNHISQVVEVMAKLYRDLVGPWRAYLPILERGEE